MKKSFLDLIKEKKFSKDELEILLSMSMLQSFCSRAVELGAEIDDSAYAGLVALVIGAEGFLAGESFSNLMEESDKFFTKFLEESFLTENEENER